MVTHQNIQYLTVDKNVFLQISVQCGACVRAGLCVLRKLGYIHITRDLRLTLLIVLRMPSIFVNIHS